jgi:hypothetical protein
VLKQYYPQALRRFEHKDPVLFGDFLARRPSQKHANRARGNALISLL